MKQMIKITYVRDISSRLYLILADISGELSLMKNISSTSGICTKVRTSDINISTTISILGAFFLNG